eukprot:403335357
MDSFPIISLDGQPQTQVYNKSNTIQIKQTANNLGVSRANANVFKMVSGKIANLKYNKKDKFAQSLSIGNCIASTILDENNVIISKEFCPDINLKPDSNFKVIQIPLKDPSSNNSNEGNDHLPDLKGSQLQINLENQSIKIQNFSEKDHSQKDLRSSSQMQSFTQGTQSQKYSQPSQIFIVEKRDISDSQNIATQNKSEQDKDFSQIQTQDISSNCRAEKSLGEICLKFLNQFGAKNQERQVNLEYCVQVLGIERRRIYDIVNILESFEMIKRIQKNVYCLSPPETIKSRIQAFEAKAQFNSISSASTEEKGIFKSGMEESQCSMNCIESELSQSLISIKTKRHKSLGVLTLIFIQLFLKKGPIMSLDEAADNIFEETQDGQSLFKSKSRRLYDIANVLKSLGIIKKQKDDKNKNVFLWIGSKGFSLEQKSKQKLQTAQFQPENKEINQPLISDQPKQTLNQNRINETVPQEFVVKIENYQANNSEMRAPKNVVSSQLFEQTIKYSGNTSFVSLKDKQINSSSVSANRLNLNKSQSLEINSQHQSLESQNPSSNKTSSIKQYPQNYFDLKSQYNFDKPEQTGQEAILKKRLFQDSQEVINGKLSILLEAIKRPNIGLQNQRSTLHCPKPVYKHQQQ